LTRSDISIWRRWASMGPHRCASRVLLAGVKLCLKIKLIIRQEVLQ